MLKGDRNIERPRSLGDFEGQWEIDRTITHVDGTMARFRGRAIWTPQDEGLAYEETGQLQIGNGRPVMATRRYFWTSDLAVLFEDGRFFHQVPASGGETTHWCDPDQYVVFYDFSEFPKFTVTWNVKGPRKDYEMTSMYSPARR